MFLEFQNLIACINYSYSSGRRTLALLISVLGNHTILLSQVSLCFILQVKKLENQKKETQGKSNLGVETHEVQVMSPFSPHLLKTSNHDTGQQSRGEYQPNSTEKAYRYSSIFSQLNCSSLPNLNCILSQYHHL